MTSLPVLRQYYHLTKPRVVQLIVFFVTGLWHGASWHFVAWGIFHGTFIVLERSGWGTLLERAWRPFQHIYTLNVVVVAWVFFRADNLSH